MGDLLLEPNGLVEVSTERRRAIVRFISPETRNPLSTPVLRILERAIEKCERIDYLDELIFTGTGEIFASGADLREIAALTADAVDVFAARGQNVMDRISNLPIRTTALINGYCYGGALDLTLACDRRIAFPNATFCHPGARLGIMTGWGGTQRLPRLVGEANALKMFFTADTIDAAEALRIGLIDEIRK